MYENLSGESREAISAGDNSVIKSASGIKAAASQTSDDKSVTDDASWFAGAAQGLLKPKPGTALHYITGFDERSCQRYAADAVKPPGYLVRSWLRSEQGGPFLVALMEGAEPAWWRELKRAQRITAQVDQLNLD